MFPKQFPITRISDAVAVTKLEIDISRLRIDSGSAYAIAAVNDIAEVIGIAHFPELFAGHGVQAKQGLADVLADLAVKTEGVELAVGDDRGARAVDVIRPEFAAGFAFLRQAGFQRSSGVERAAPVEPAGGFSGAGREQRQSGKKQGEFHGGKV